MNSRILEAMNEGIIEAAALGNELAISMLNDVESNHKLIEVNNLEFELNKIKQTLNLTKHSKRAEALKKRQSLLRDKYHAAIGSIQAEGAVGDYEKVC